MAGQEGYCTWLVSHGAHVDQQDAAGNTALHCAAHSGLPNLVQELLRLKADRTIKTKA